MGFPLFREVKEHAPASLTHREKLVALVLADDANDGTRMTWHSTEDPEIMRMAMVPDVRAMRRVLARLREEKVIEHAGGGHNGKIAKFRFLPLGPAVKEGDPDPATGSVGGQNPPGYSHDPEGGAGENHPATSPVGGSSGASSRAKSATPTPQTPHDSSSLSAGRAPRNGAAITGLAPDDERELLEWIKERHRPGGKQIDNPTAYLRKTVANGDLGNLLALREADRATRPAPRPQLPDWCGKCGVDTGNHPDHVRVNPRLRYLDGRKCAACHPDVIGSGP